MFGLVCSTTAKIRIPKIKKNHAARMQHPPHFAKHLDQLGNVGFGRFLQADLLVDATRATARAFALVALLPVPIGCLST